MKFADGRLCEAYADGDPCAVSRVLDWNPGERLAFISMIRQRWADPLTALRAHVSLFAD